MHATNGSYNRGCRCEQCRNAHRITARAYSIMHREQMRKRSQQLRDELPGAKPEPWIQPAQKPRNWMDIRAEEVWAKLKSEEPRPFRMFRSPLHEL